MLSVVSGELKVASNQKINVVSTGESLPNFFEASSLLKKRSGHLVPGTFFKLAGISSANTLLTGMQPDRLV